MDPDRRRWLQRVAEAAREAADAVCQLQDARGRDLLTDLDDLHERLTTELRAAETDG